MLFAVIHLLYYFIDLEIRCAKIKLYSSIQDYQQVRKSKHSVTFLARPLTIL